MFVDVMDEMGIDNLYWLVLVVLVDVNCDGWFDIYVINYVDYYVMC